jgi:non-canonical purine NTP pyrophosphatase (RdgB/HAM1 family)
MNTPLHQDFSYLTLVTGNKNKAQEIAALLPGIKILDIDLPELQELDNKKIIHAKIQAALEHTQGPIIVDDGGLYLDCLGGQLPGPLIKWFMKTMKNTGLFAIADRLGNYGARATCIIGFARNAQDIHFFEGSMRGTLVAEQPNTPGFGWDTVFIPEGYQHTFANFDLTTKNSMSMRAQALNELKKFLSQQHQAQQTQHSNTATPN